MKKEGRKAERRRSRREKKEKKEKKDPHRREHRLLDPHDARPPVPVLRPRSRSSLRPSALWRGRRCWWDRRPSPLLCLRSRHWRSSEARGRAPPPPLAPPAFARWRPGPSRRSSSCSGTPLLRRRRLGSNCFNRTRTVPPPEKRGDRGLRSAPRTARLAPLRRRVRNGRVPINRIQVWR